MGTPAPRNKILRYTVIGPLCVGLLAILVGGSGGISHWVDIGYYRFLDSSAVIRSIEKKYGIDIETQAGSEAIPELWRLPPASGEATPISEFELSRYLRLLPDLLGQYPVGIIRTNLDRIVLLENLRFYGVPYGGTSLGRTLYLTSASRAKGFGDHYLRYLFHHELSSTLYRNYPFPGEQWGAVNPPGFSYRDDDTQVLKSIERDRVTAGGESLLREGFLSEYSKSTLENDVNLYAETVFVDPERMRELVETYSAVREKYLLLKHFYLGIDAEFSAAFKAVL